ncbi:MAG TPA: molecular chaperone DnaJ [Acidimicrobiales bacterium]|nr:molecular chaperone DnaJ [Acidimicrobiales bacterium]
MATDYYQLLGVSKSATDDEIKRAYRQLARKLHPDVNGGSAEDEAKFKEVSVAYETLSDPERRRRYDMFGADGPRVGGPSEGFGGGFGDLFDAFFGGGGFGGTQHQSGPRRGDDVEVVLDIAFEEAVFGIERSVSYRGPVACKTCAATGAEPGTTPTRCRDCDGQGQVRRVRQSILGQVVTTSPCAICRGLGEIIEKPCQDCRGEGRRTEERNVTVEVPAGVDAGTTLRITGSGAAPPRGGIAGDLYVHLRVLPSDRYARDGADLLMTLNVALTQAALGAAMMVDTLDGEERIEIAPGTQTGKTIRLRGKGVPHLRSRGRGDLHIRIVVDTPTNLNKEQEQLLRELALLREEPIQESGLFTRIKSTFS